MILSMTGYGRKTFNLNGKNVVLEIKALNSKSLDLNVRLVPLFKEYEMDIRNALNTHLIRGKVDCNIGYETGDDKNGDINHSAVKEYYKQLKEIAGELQVDDSKIFDLVFRLPNVTTTSAEALSEEQQAQLLQHVSDACKQLNTFRSTEGVNLEKDLELRIVLILQALEEVEKLDPQRVEQQRARMHADLQNFMQDQEIDMNRFEQELIFYLEKMDITEEVIRLRSHCSYFTETLHENIMEKGKKLGFITQEMNREINTIGSKSYFAEMQRKVVMMKDELEKIKEQLNNVL
ncbi:MAG: YicC/YloC family endoribonuclease [Chitinophagales bacterium]